MAYISQERKKALEPAIKAICNKYGVKARLAVNNHSTLVLNVKSGKIDFIGSFNRMIDDRDPTGNRRINLARDYIQVNTYWYQEHYDGAAREFLAEVLKAMKSNGWYDNTDTMIDYFDIAYYVDINIGKWDKPYILEA
jgi:hypothetical protein